MLTAAGGTLAQCRSQHGNWLIGSENIFQPFSQQLRGENENIDRFNITVGKETKAPIEFLPGKSVTVLSGVIDNWENHTGHHLPMGPKSTVIQELKNAGLICVKIMEPVRRRGGEDGIGHLRRMAAGIGKAADGRVPDELHHPNSQWKTL